MTKQFVAYYRVSTDHQGIHGLGMDAQRFAVGKLLGETTPIAEFSEVESGKVRERPELNKALDLCRRDKATLVIAKLDRLARNAAFVLGLRDAGVEFVAADMPQANRLTIGILAVIAEHEREMISQRTKEGLSAAKRNGKKLGNPHPQKALELARAKRVEGAKKFNATILPVVQQIKTCRITSLRGIAAALNARGLTTFYGRQFKAQTVRNLLEPESI